MNVKFNTNENILNKLEFLCKYDKLVTVSQSSLTTKRLKIIFSSPIMYSDDFTVNIKDLLSILRVTNEFEINNKNITVYYTKFLETNNFNVEIKKTYRIYDEKYKLSNSNVLMSIKIKNLQILNLSNITIKCNKNGDFSIFSNDIIETMFKTKVEIIDCNVDEIETRLRGSNLKILDIFDQDKIFYFFNNFILVYILEDLCTIIFMLNIFVI